MYAYTIVTLRIENKCISWYFQSVKHTYAGKVLSESLGIEPAVLACWVGRSPSLTIDSKELLATQPTDPMYAYPYTHKHTHTRTLSIRTWGSKTH